MIWNLTYRAFDQSPIQAATTLRWVTPTGWTEQAIKDDFERRHSGTKVVSLEPTEVAA